MWDERNAEDRSLCLPPALIGCDEFPLAIPWRVGLHQSPPPLHQPGTACSKLGSPVEDFAANGELSLNCLSHPRGQAHYPLHCYYWPLRHPLVFHRFPGNASYTVSCSPDFSPGRVGLLQLLYVSLSSCCRYRPARVSRRISQFASVHTAFALRPRARPLGPGFSGSPVRCWVRKWRRGT